VEFNPWLFSGREQRTALFFGVLAEQLNEQLGKRRSADAAQRLRSYGAALGTLRALPAIGGLFDAGAAVIDEAARRLDRSKMDLHGQRNRLGEALRKLDVHIVVVIDDVDRLSPRRRSATLCGWSSWWATFPA
jgi:predicted KAP-like P-loop ATPase